MNIENKLLQMGLTLPQAPRPVAAYVPAVVFGNLAYTSGQLPFVDGQLPRTGLLGQDLSVEEGQEMARIALLNCLAALKQELGHLGRIARVLKLTGYVQCVAGFTAQPQVINGASELLQELFGPSGRHARAAVGVNALPLNAPVEVDVVVGLHD